MGEFEHKVNKINNSAKTDREKDIQLGELTENYRPRVEKQNQDYLLSKGSTAAKMTLTGARGNSGQLMQASSGSLITVDAQGKPIPVAVVHSFAEGMSPSEHLAMSYTARGNTVLTQLSTALPGALFKKLTPNLFHEVITIEDCKTKNGIPVPGTDKKAMIGRYTADTNKIITEELYNDLRNKKFVKVRSPMTCEAKDGVCVHCYGLLATGKKPEIGFNVGVISAQSVSEVLTQSMLSTKHSSRSAGKKSRNTYEVVNNLLSNPENFQDEATIAQLNGTVDKIHKTALNDHDVYVNGHKHFVPNEQDLAVKLGDKVETGQPLSTGTINPRELVGLTGIGNGRTHFANQLRESYGSDLDPRHFELISKNLMKYVRVDNPGTTDFSHGEIVDINKLEPQLREDETQHKLHNA
jgi:DNA-directed RNA polymerase subunit beta'